MGLRLNTKNSSIFQFIFVFLLGLVLVLAPAISAQEIGADDNRVGKTAGSIKDLGRRSKCGSPLESHWKMREEVTMGRMINEELHVTTTKKIHI